MTFVPFPVWRSFQTLDSNAEAASASACCNYSLGTLEISCSYPGMVNFALTEQKRVDIWRWAVVNTHGQVISTGCESSRARAHHVAELALRTGVD